MRDEVIVCDISVVILRHGVVQSIYRWVVSRTVDDELKGELCASLTIDTDTDVVALVGAPQRIQRQSWALQILLTSIYWDATFHYPVDLHVLAVYVRVHSIIDIRLRLQSTSVNYFSLVKYSHIGE